MLASTLALAATLGLSPAVPSPAATPSTAPEQATTPAPQAVPRSSVRTPRMRRRAAVGMTIAGSVLTAGFLGGAALVGAVFLDSPDAAQRSMGRVLPMPFVGPFLAADRAPRAVRKPAPFVVMGIEQLAAATVLGVGAVSLHRHRTLKREGGEARRLDQNAAVGLITGGILATVLTYGLTVGLSRGRARAGDPFARRLHIPFVGGIAAAPVAPSHVRGFGGLTTSALQLGGLAVTTIGAVALARHRPARRLSVLPMGDATSVHVTATLRF